LKVKRSLTEEEAIELAENIQQQYDDYLEYLREKHTKFNYEREQLLKTKRTINVDGEEIKVSYEDALSMVKASNKELRKVLNKFNKEANRLVEEHEKAMLRAKAFEKEGVDGVTEMREHLQQVFELDYNAHLASVPVELIDAYRENQEQIAATNRELDILALEKCSLPANPDAYKEARGKENKCYLS
jgi:prefoldin subunit 5